MDTSMMQDDGSEEPAKDDQNESLDKICVDRRRDGTYSVYMETEAEKPDVPEGGLADAPEAGPVAEEAQECDTREEMLKAVMKLDVSKPVSGDEHAQMMAGGRSEPGYGEGMA